MNIVGPIIGALTGAVTGFLLGLWSDQLRNYFFGPKLAISFDPTNRDDYIANTGLRYGLPDGRVIETEAKFVRVGVTNTGRTAAHSCRAYLAKVEREQDGVWMPTKFSDVGILSWSSRADEAFSGITIPSGMKVYFDVFRTIKDGHEKVMPTLAFCTNVIPFRAQSTLESGGRFRITVVCAPDRSKPKSYQITLGWFGKWDDFSVARVPTDEPRRGACWTRLYSVRTFLGALGRPAVWRVRRKAIEA
jgi:hypothetical protein